MICFDTKKEREHSQAPILGGGDLRSKYNRLGLDAVTRKKLLNGETNKTLVSPACFLAKEGKFRGSPAA